MRLINADALIAEMHNVILEDGEDRRTFYEVIERQPTIEERKTGKWIYAPTEPLGYICSECKKGCCRYNFCPNCGADMRGEQE